MKTTPTYKDKIDLCAPIIASLTLFFSISFLFMRSQIIQDCDLYQDQQKTYQKNQLNNQ